MSLPGVWPQVLDFFGTPLAIEPSPGQLSGDAGLLPIRQCERFGLEPFLVQQVLRDEPVVPLFTDLPG